MSWWLSFLCVDAGRILTTAAGEMLTGVRHDLLLARWVKHPGHFSTGITAVCWSFFGRRKQRRITSSGNRPRTLRVGFPPNLDPNRHRLSTCWCVACFQCRSAHACAGTGPQSRQVLDTTPRDATPWITSARPSRDPFHQKTGKHPLRARAVVSVRRDEHLSPQSAYRDDGPNR